MNLSRRELASATVAFGVGLPLLAADTGPRHLSTNVYPWGTFFNREKKNFDKDLDASLAAVKESGVDGFEPVGASPQQMKAFGPLLKKHGLEMRSFYVNSTLHTEGDVKASIASVLAIAEAARELGATIAVTNPSPIRWGGPEDKTDEQLKRQAAALDQLGAALRKQGVTLAYHNHDVELRKAAREFHHMLTATDPANVKFCLDAHWVFRGSGDSQLALFDAVTHYAGRIVELHLRQSRGGVWAETFTAEGDIDYARLWNVLAAKKLSPLLVLEQAVEAKSAHTLTAVEAHKKSVAAARALFG